MALNNKTIVITGGTSGIGLAVVQKLSQTNQLIVIGRNQQKLDALAQQNPNIHTYQADLADISALEWAASALLKNHPRIDVLINNAAVQHPATFVSQQFDYANIQAEITTNFTSICCLCYLLLPALQAGTRATIVNVNSGLALAPKTSSAVYCATKSALNSFSLSLRYQLEPTGIRVQQAFMPLVDTAMTQGRGKGKLSIEQAANALIEGIERGVNDHNIGKIVVLRWLLRLMPSVAHRMLKNS